jgi:hypothetical protein
MRNIEINSKWDYSLYANIHLSKNFYLFTAVYEYEHHSSETPWLFFVGPSYKINFSRKTFDFDLYLGASAVVGSGDGGLGGTGRC